METTAVGSQGAQHQLTKPPLKTAPNSNARASLQRPVQSELISCSVTDKCRVLFRQISFYGSITDGYPIITLTDDERIALDRVIATRTLQPASEGGLAGADCPYNGARARSHRRRDGQGQDDDLLLAGALCRRGRGRTTPNKTRRPGTLPLFDEIKVKVLTKTTTETPANATHWSVRSMAKEMGISHTSVQRIWPEAGIEPHLVRTFKISNDPELEEKVTDVVGLCMNPPDKALVLWRRLQREPAALFAGLSHAGRVCRSPSASPPARAGCAPATGGSRAAGPCSRCMKQARMLADGFS